MNVYSSLCRGPLEIKGCFHLQGPQVTSAEEGTAPKWLEKVFEENPKVKIIAVSGDDFGEVFQRQD
jgi:hypothetical protein